MIALTAAIGTADKLVYGNAAKAIPESSSFPSTFGAFR
jgi:hypothetical protein